MLHYTIAVRTISHAPPSELPVYLLGL